MIVRTTGAGSGVTVLSLGDSHFSNLFYSNNVYAKLTKLTALLIPAHPILRRNDNSLTIFSTFYSKDVSYRQFAFRQRDGIKRNSIFTSCLQTQKHANVADVCASRAGFEKCVKAFKKMVRVIAT